jgi:tRNA G46 methylase TrmB
MPAEWVLDAFIRDGSVNTIVFYDPLPGDADRKEATRLLKAQVHYFID